MRQIMAEELLLAIDTGLLLVASPKPKESWLYVKQPAPEFGDVDVNSSEEGATATARAKASSICS